MARDMTTSKLREAWLLAMRQGNLPYAEVLEDEADHRYENGDEAADTSDWADELQSEANAAQAQSEATP